MVKAKELLWTAKEQREDLEWGLAETVYRLSADTTPEWIAREYGFSAAKVRRYILTVQTFPNPAKDFPFEIHMIGATKTADPEYWLDQAMARAWTPKELRAAIKEAGVPRTDCDWTAQGEAILHRLRKFYAEAPGPVVTEIRRKAKYLQGD